MKTKKTCNIVYRLSSICHISLNIQQYSTRPPNRRIATYDERLEKLLNTAPKLDGSDNVSEWNKARHEIHELILSKPMCERRN